jgi:hypothetical protein
VGGPSDVVSGCGDCGRPKCQSGKKLSRIEHLVLVRIKEDSGRAKI